MRSRILLPLFLLALLACSSAKAERVMQVRGVTFANAHRGNMGYGSDSSREQLDRLAELGANWVTLCEFAWMESVREPDHR